MTEYWDIHITYRKADEIRFTNILWPNWAAVVLEETTTRKTALLEAAPGNLLEEREQLAVAGLCFYGHYTGTAGSAPGLFAACNGHHIDSMGFNGEPTVILKPDGTFDPATLREAKHYLKTYRRALNALAR